MGTWRGAPSRARYTYGAGEVCALCFVARVYGEVSCVVCVPGLAAGPQNIMVGSHVLMMAELRVGFPPRQLIIATQGLLWRFAVVVRSLFQVKLYATNRNIGRK